MLLWHALEESEHKAVAFDVYRAAGGSERMRIWTMRVVTFTFILGVIGHTTASLLADRATYNLPRLARSLFALRHSPFLTREVVLRVHRYNKPGFHPDDNDNSALLERWRARLFGSDGALTDHLR
jgi:predicted metal-dependent hydrolase